MASNRIKVVLFLIHVDVKSCVGSGYVRVMETLCEFRDGGERL